MSVNALAGRRPAHRRRASDGNARRRATAQSTVPAGAICCAPAKAAPTNYRPVCSRRTLSFNGAKPSADVITSLPSTTRAPCTHSHPRSMVWTKFGQSESWCFQMTQRIACPVRHRKLLKTHGVFCRFDHTLSNRRVQWERFCPTVCTRMVHLRAATRPHPTVSRLMGAQHLSSTTAHDRAHARARERAIPLPASPTGNPYRYPCTPYSIPIPARQAKSYRQGVSPAWRPNTSLYFAHADENSSIKKGGPIGTPGMGPRNEF